MATGVGVGLCLGGGEGGEADPLRKWVPGMSNMSCHKWRSVQCFRSLGGSSAGRADQEDDDDEETALFGACCVIARNNKDVISATIAIPSYRTVFTSKWEYVPSS